MFGCVSLGGNERRKTGRYYNVPVSGFIVDYNPLPVGVWSRALPQAEQRRDNVLDE